MKDLLFKLAGTLMLLAFAFPASGDNPFCGNIGQGNFVLVGLTPYPRYDEEPELPEKGKRDTPERLPASITESGVTIERVSESEIDSFDIYTPSGILLDSFGSGEEFATSLFSLNGEYELRFTTSEYVYVGYVRME